MPALPQSSLYPHLARKRALHSLLALFVSVPCLASCTANSTSGEEIITTVQETNVDDEPRCDDGLVMSLSYVTRECDQVNVAVIACSRAPLCESALAELEADVAGCAVDVGSSTWLAECPE